MLPRPHQDNEKINLQCPSWKEKRKIGDHKCITFFTFLKHRKIHIKIMGMDVKKFDVNSKLQLRLLVDMAATAFGRNSIMQYEI